MIDTERYLDEKQNSSEDWVVVHDNGVAGQEGFTDGFRSEDEVKQFITEAEKEGITVYRYFRAE